MLSYILVKKPKLFYTKSHLRKQVPNFFVIILPAEELIGTTECEFQYKFNYKMLAIKEVTEVKRIMIHMGKVLISHLCLKIGDGEQP